jgi:hypothetical protein
MMTERDLIEKHISTLTENEFRERVLIPLFKSMGFKGVMNYHGGSKELGKDIVMWKEEELLGRQNYAVVVKVGQITGSVEGKGTFQTVTTQAIQALNSTFRDEKTLEEHSVHKCFIVTNQSIKKEANDALYSLLKKQVDIRQVIVLNINELIEKIIQHNIVPISPDDLFSMLDELNKNRIFKIDGIRNINGQKIVEFRGDSNVPLEKTRVNMTFKFPDDSEGCEMKKKMKEFIDHGEPIDIPGKYIKFDSPEFNKEIGNKGIAKISIGNITNPRVFIFSIEIIDENGNSFRIPFLEFKKKHAGQKSFTLICDFELLAFTISIRIENDNETRFNYSSKNDLSNYTMYELLLFQEFILAISRGGEMSFYDTKTNIRVFYFKIKKNNNPNQNDIFYELCKKGNIIQQKTNTRLYYPNDGFTEEDVNDINELYTIITTGYQKNIHTTVTFHLKDMKYLDNRSSSNEIQKLDLIVQVSQKYTLLKKTIDTGIVNYFFSSGILNYRIISEKDIEVKVSTNKDCPAYAYYEKFFNRGTRNDDIL